MSLQEILSHADPVAFAPTLRCRCLLRLYPSSSLEGSSAAMSQVSKPPPSIAPARQAAFAWDCSSPSRALRADVRPLRSVFLQLVPRLSVAVHTVLRVPRPRPLAADDDRIAPSGMCDPSRKTHRLTSGRFACYKVVWSSPGALGMVHTVSASLTPQASGSGAGGEKGLWNSYPPTARPVTYAGCHYPRH